MTGVPALSYSQERVVAIETNAFAGTAYLEINRDDSGSLKSITYRSHDGRVLSYSLAQLRAGPQVIKQDGSHDVVFLSVEIDFSATKGGHANLRFLKSTGHFRTLCHFRESRLLQKQKAEFPMCPGVRRIEFDQPADRRFRDVRTFVIQPLNPP